MPRAAGNRDAQTRFLQVLSALRAACHLPANLTGAAIAGDVASIEAFLRRGSDIEERTIGFGSPLCAACSAGQVKAVRFLLDRGARLDPADAIVTPLHAAVGNGHRDVFAELVARGAPIAAATTGFLVACSKGRTRMVRQLVEAGLDLGAPASGKTLRQLGIEAAQSTGEAPLVVATLRQKPVSDADLEAEEARHAAERRKLVAGLAATRGEQPVATESERPALIEQALDLIRGAGAAAASWTDQDGESVLGLAARTGAVSIVDALLDRHADPRHRAPVTGFTALYRGAEGGHTDVVVLLLGRGADANTAAAGRVTPLMLAAQSGQREMVVALLAAGAIARAKDVNGRTAARYASGPLADAIVVALGPRSPRGKKAARPPTSRHKEPGQ